MGLGTSKAPTGIVIYPHGMIERHKLKVDSSITWGNADEKGADPAWLTPSTFRLSNKGKFALLPSLMLLSIPMPGETQVIASEERITRAYKERYQYTMDHAQGLGRDAGQLYFMIVVGLLTLAFVVTVVALGLPQFIKNFQS